MLRIEVESLQSKGADADSADFELIAEKSQVLIDESEQIKAQLQSFATKKQSAAMLLAQKVKLITDTTDQDQQVEAPVLPAVDQKTVEVNETPNVVESTSTQPEEKEVSEIVEQEAAAQDAVESVIVEEGSETSQENTTESQAPVSEIVVAQEEGTSESAELIAEDEQPLEDDIPTDIEAPVSEVDDVTGQEMEQVKTLEAIIQAEEQDESSWSFLLLKYTAAALGVLALKSAYVDTEKQEQKINNKNPENLLGQSMETMSSDRKANESSYMPLSVLENSHNPYRGSEGLITVNDDEINLD